MLVKIDAAGRIVVPKAVRDQLGLRAGTEVELDLVDDRIEITVERPRATIQIRNGLPVIVPSQDTQPLSNDDVLALIDAVREDRSRVI